MLRENKAEREQMEMVCIEEMVPKKHILRKIDSAIDFTHIYDLVGDMYCKNNGRPSIDPVLIFKMVLIQHLFGIPSLRKTAEEVCKYILSLVFRISSERADTALFNTQL